MPNRGEYEVRCGMDVVLKEMGSIVETYGGEKLGRFYGEAEPGEEIDWPE